MSLKERVYSILLVTASETLVSVVKELLPENRYDPLCTAASTSSAKRKLTEKTFDFVIINAPLPDDFGTRFAIDASSARQTIVLLLVKQELHDAIHDQTTEYGVFTLPKPFSRPMIRQAFHWMESARERLRQSEKKSLSIEEKMAEIRLVNKAKWLLISERNMEEPEAHRYIEKQAMDQCTTKKQIAEEILKTYQTSSIPYSS